MITNILLLIVIVILLLALALIGVIAYAKKLRASSIPAPKSNTVSAEIGEQLLKAINKTTEMLERLSILMPLLLLDKRKVAEDLAAAAKKNDVALFKSYREIRAWSDPNLKLNENKDTPAIIAARNLPEEWAEELLLMLIEMKADLTIVNTEKVTARKLIVKHLFEAAEEPDLAKLNHYLENGILHDINMQNEDNDTFGHIALEERSMKFFKWFIQQGGRVDIPGKAGKTVEAILAEDPEVRMFKVIVEKTKSERAESVKAESQTD